MVLRGRAAHRDPALDFRREPQPGPPFGITTFQFFREIKFPEWREYAESPEYPQQQENENDYLEGNFRILVWRVVEELVENGTFNCLKSSKPFLISYGLHDQEQRIIRILNWPSATK